LLTPASSLNEVESAQQIVAIYPQRSAECKPKPKPTFNCKTGHQTFGRQTIWATAYKPKPTTNMKK